MYNKKILFIISNPSQFKNFLETNSIRLTKNVKSVFLIYPYGFSSNKYLAKDVKQWIKSIKKKTIIKKNLVFRPIFIFGHKNQHKCKSKTIKNN